MVIITTVGKQTTTDGLTEERLKTVLKIKEAVNNCSSLDEDSGWFLVTLNLPFLLNTVRLACRHLIWSLDRKF